MRTLAVASLWIVAVVALSAGIAACRPTEQPKPVTTPIQEPKDTETEAPADTAEEPGGQAEAPAEKTLTIGVMPKLVGIPFFNATERGALEAGKELRVNVVFDGPVINDVQLQVQMLETWIAKKYDAIAVAPNDPDAIAPVLAKARSRGVKVVAWDADAQRDARDFFVNQCTSASVAQALMDVMPPPTRTSGWTRWKNTAARNTPI